MKMAPALGRDGGYFDRAMRCCSFFAWRRIERFSCRPFSSMCFAVLSARLSADLIVSALIRACITFFPNAFPIAFSLVESRSAPGWLTLWFPASCEAVAGISPSSRAPAHSHNPLAPPPARAVLMACCSWCQPLNPRHAAGSRPLPIEGLPFEVRNSDIKRSAGMFEGDVKGARCYGHSGAWKQRRRPAFFG